jgi:hypothetical protein
VAHAEFLGDHDEVARSGLLPESRRFRTHFTCSRMLRLYLGRF